MRVLSSSLYKDNTFSAEMQIVLTYRNILRNVKRRVLHTRGFRMCYITRPRLGRTATHLGLVLVANTTMDGYCNKYLPLIKNDPPAILMGC